MKASFDFLNCFVLLFKCTNMSVESKWWRCREPFEKSNENCFFFNDCEAFCWVTMKPQQSVGKLLQSSNKHSLVSAGFSSWSISLVVCTQPRWSHKLQFLINVSASYKCIAVLCWVCWSIPTPTRWGSNQFSFQPRFISEWKKKLHPCVNRRNSKSKTRQINFPTSNSKYQVFGIIARVYIIFIY